MSASVGWYEFYHLSNVTHLVSQYIVLFTVQSGISPLYIASREGHTAVVDSLLKSGANPNMATTV